MLVTDSFFSLKIAKAVKDWIESSPIEGLNDSLKFEYTINEDSELFCTIVYESDFVGTLLTCVFNAGDKVGYERCNNNNVLAS